MELEGLKSVEIDAENNRLLAIFERDGYPADAVYGAAYAFIDRCWVLLDTPDDGTVRVELAGRAPVDAEGLSAWARELADELTSQAWCHAIKEQNRPLIEAVTAQALAGGAADDGALDDLDEMDFSDDTFDDPLGIARSWEEAQGQPDADPPVEGEPKGPPPDGEPSDGEPSDGEPSDGEPSDGEPSDGEPSDEGGETAGSVARTAGAGEEAGGSEADEEKPAGEG